MIKIEKFNENDIPELLDWLKNTDKKFLIQFSGNNYKYPLNDIQLKNELKKAENEKNQLIFKGLNINTNKVIGHCQLLNIDYNNGSARIGKVIINPNERGKNYGFYMMKELLNYSFNILNLKKLNLSVFDFNHIAYNCYKKLCFKEIKIVDHYFESIDETWKKIAMEIDFDQYKKMSTFHNNP